jgi:hypothetical protein
MARSASLAVLFAAAAALLARPVSGVDMTPPGVNDAFKVEDKVTYLSGRGIITDVGAGMPPANLNVVGPANVFDPDIWHDASDPANPLKINIRIFEIHPSHNLAAINSATWITVTGSSPLGAPVPTTAVKVAAASKVRFMNGNNEADVTGSNTVADNTFIDIVVTFDTTAPPGTTYKINYDCALVKDGTAATSATASTGDCDYESNVETALYVKIGWAPIFTVLEKAVSASDVDEDVTGQWIDLGEDPADSTKLLVPHSLRIEVTPGKTLRTGANPNELDARSPAQAPNWPSGVNDLDMDELFLGETDATAITDGFEAVFTSTNVNDFTPAALTAFSFDPATLTGDEKKKFIRIDFAPRGAFEPDVFVVRIKSGALLRSDFAPSAQTSFVINAGFRLDPSFITTETKTVNNVVIPYDVPDSWFPAAKPLALKVMADNAPTGYKFDGTSTAALTPYGIGVNQLLFGMTKLPGSITINGAPTRDNPAGLFYTYALTTSSVAPGKYDFNMAQGVISITKASSTTIKNARRTHTLKIGFVPDISILEGTAPVKVTDVDERKVVTTSWLNLDGTSGSPTLPHALVVKPPAGFTFNAAAVASLTVATTFVTSGADISGKIAFVTTEFASRTTPTTIMKTTTYIEATFDPVGAYTPGAYDLDIASSKFMRNDEVMSCKVTLTIRAGFEPTITFKDIVTSKTDKWFLNDNEDVNLVVTADGLDETVKPLYLITGSNNLLSGMATLPGGTAAVAGSGIKGPPAADIDDSTDEVLQYPLTLAGTEPGEYVFVIANGALLNTDSSRNYETKATLKIGYLLDYDIVDSDTKKVVASRRGSTVDKGYLNPNNAHTIVLMPGTFTNPAGVVKVNTFSAATVGAIPNPSTAYVFCDDAVCDVDNPNKLDNTMFLGTTTPGTGDEGRITYTLAAEALATVGPYDVYVPEELFKREFTDALNAAQKIEVNVGFDIKIYFSDEDDITLVTSSSTNKDLWWHGEEADIFMHIKGAVSLVNTAVSFETLFPGDNPGSCSYPGGITAGTPTPVNAGQTYTLDNVDKLAPGKYRFDIPAGAFSKLAATTLKNFAASEVLKIGFKTLLDVVDGDGKSLMSTETDSESLSSARKKFAVRALVTGMTAEQAVATFNTATTATTPADGLVADDDADSQTSCTACITLASSVGSFSVDPSPRYIATFKYPTTPTVAAAEKKSFVYTAKQGVWCTLASNADDAQICNAATKTDKAVKLRFGYDTTAKIGITAAETPPKYSDDASTGKYNIFDADQTSVITMPIFSPALIIQVIYDVVPTGDYLDLVSLPDGLAEPDDAFVSASKALTLEWVKAGGSATNVLTPGTYDIVVKPDTIVSSGFYNHRLKIRLVIGPQPVFYMLDQKTLINPRAAGGPFSTNINTVFFGLAGTNTDDVKLTDLLMVKDANGNVVTSALSIEDKSTVPDPDYITDAVQGPAPIWRVGLSGLTDGIYTFIVGGDDLSNEDPDVVAYNAKALTATSNNFKDLSTAAFAGPPYKVNEFMGGLKVKVIIDRKAPTPKDITFANRVIYSGAPSGTIALSPDLFADEGTPDANLAVTVTSADDKGMLPVGTTLAAATLSSSAANVRDPPGGAVFKVTATDEAGNTADALFTVPVLTRSSGTLTAIDARVIQSKTTLYTGGPDSLTKSKTASQAGHLPLKVIVDFEVPVSNVIAQSLSCVVGCAACTYVTSSSLPTGVKLTAAPGGKRFTYEFTLDKTQVDDAAKVELKLVMTSTVGSKTTTITSTAGTYDVIAPASVFVLIDTIAPTPVNFIAPYRATVNAKFSLTLPSKLYYDIASDAKKIKLISSTPASQFGLQFTADNQGNATITGIPLAQPPLASDNRVRFSIIGQDEAGNNGAPVDVIIEINKAPTTAPVFTVKGALLTFTEKDSDVDEDTELMFDTGATFTAPAGTTFFAVKAYLTRPENNELSNPACKNGNTIIDCKEFLDADDLAAALTAGGGDCPTTGSNPTPPADNPADYAYAVDSLTGEGSVGISCKTGLTPAVIQAWVRSLTYVNTRTDVTGGTRVIRVDVWAADNIMIGQRIDALGNTVKGTELSGNGVTATAARTLRVVAVNNVPTIEVTATSSWTEAGIDATVFSLATIVDTDDNDLTAAYVSIALTASAGAYGACDKARDVLYLKTDYLTSSTVKGKSPKVVGTWSPASCTLTLIPAAPLTRVTKAEMKAALEAVKYKNADPKNPVNFALATDTFALKRQISVFIEDAANQGKLADKKRSARVDGKTINILTINPSADAPIIDLLAIFRTGSGILSSTDKYANLETTYDPDNLALGLVKIKAFPLVLPAIYDAAGKDVDLSDPDAPKVVYQLKFDLTQVKDANSNPVPGTFAKGQIYDPDSATIASGAKGAEVKWIKDDQNTLEVSALAAPVGATGGYPNTFVAETTGEDGTPYETGFEYSATEDSVLTIILQPNTPADNAPDNRLARYTFRLTFETETGSSSSVDFFVDLRQKACLDSSAGRFKTSDSATETYVIKRYQTRDEDPLTVPASSFFPDNALCAYPPTAVIAASGERYDVNRGGYADQKKDLDAALLALKNTGASIESQVAALKDLRNAARGSFTVGIPAGSLASRGSMDLTANKADAGTLSLLPVVTDAVETVDLDVAIKIQPAGTSFSIPVKICLFAGDTPEGSYKVMAVAQQKDPGDPSKGYTPWEKLFDQSFNPATGEVCGYTLHFSVFAPITRPQASSLTVTKAHLMGGSCPNQCSGHGTCRQEGQCACFAGFEGYDCSMRTCPSAESWGQDQEVMHTQSECAGRGVCKRETGTCSCFDGYEGAACERATCANDCSGHGRCRTLAELPKVQQAGYASWEVKRLQKCLCDGGYTGSDCSLRVCPFGDDPETVCAYSKRQVQRLTLDFVTDPTATGFPDVDLSTDQFSLIFTTADGKNYTTPMIDDVWEGTVHSASAIANALRTLPEFAVMDVVVSSTSGSTTPAALKVSYDVTFTGPTNTGNEFAMSCPYNSLGSTGCPAPGCRPKFTQLRVLKVPYMPPAVQISPLTVLQQPLPLGKSANDNSEATPGVFGVETTLVISKYTMPGSSETVYTYKFENTKIYGQSRNFAGTATALVIEETPIPPTALRRSVAGPYGILVDFGSDTQFSIDYASTGSRVSYPLAWRLPKCSVEVVSAADKDLEKAECSNRGLCDREAGECRCFTGYAGYSCSQQTVYT